MVSRRAGFSATAGLFGLFTMLMKQSVCCDC